MASSGRRPEAPSFALNLFGPFQAVVNSEPLPLERPPQGWILAFLALKGGGPVRRDHVAEALWPGSDAHAARRNLTNRLSELRRALGDEAWRFKASTTQTLRLDLSRAEVDVVTFDVAVARDDAASLEQAVSLYRGPLLDGWTEAWAFEERQSRDQAYLDALEKLAERMLKQGDLVRAEEYLRRAVAVDLERESTWRALMHTLGSSGKTAAAIRVYHELRERLHRELHSQPDPETTTLFEKIRRSARDRAASGKPVLPIALSPPRSASPPQLPDGTVTFLFTEVVGSANPSEEDALEMPEAVGRYQVLLAAAVDGVGGVVFGRLGSRLCAVFATAPDALAAALAVQRALQPELWGPCRPLPIRMALHTGAATQVGSDYFGPPMDRTFRILEAGHGGQILLSQATREHVLDHLPHGTSLRDLNEHRLKGLDRPERIFQVAAPDLPRDFPPLRSLEVCAHNLPFQTTSFIGREREMAEVRHLLTTYRLLSLTGAGGCGKTRLALQVAADLVAEYEDGVWIVELASLTDPAQIPQAVATALGLSEEPGRRLVETLHDALRPKQVLLLLDNCEHLVDGCATLARDLLRVCPRLRILATSRERLEIMEEQLYLVPCLSFPSVRERPAVDRLWEFEAVRLFVDRARRSKLDFKLTDANASAIARACQRLDGIPLAIELAAAWTGVLGIDTLADRLDSRLRLIMSGNRAAPERHQTLRATIDWSYDLLSEKERKLLCCLTVFVGGFTLEAAEVVCAGEYPDQGSLPSCGRGADMHGVVGAEIKEDEILALLGRLVGKSLVWAEDRGVAIRYRLLETIRQYGVEKLGNSAEAMSLRERHRNWFLARAEEAEPSLTGPEQQVWLDRLEAEHENLRTALTSFCEDDGEIAAGLRLASALAPFWHVRGHPTEGREHLAAMLGRVDAVGRTPARARALGAAATLAWGQSDFEEASSLATESLAIGQELDDKWSIAAAVYRLGNIARLHGHYETAHSQLLHALELYRGLGSEAHLANSLYSLACVALARCDFASAGSCYGESLTIYQAIGNKGGVGDSLLGMGYVHYYQGDHDAAAVCFAEGRTLFDALQDKRMLAHSYLGLGSIASSGREYETARSHHAAALQLFQQVNDRQGMGDALTRLADVAALQGQSKRAACLWGAAEALLDAIHAPLPPDRREESQRRMAEVRTHVGEADFAAAWAKGSAMTLQQAVCTALADPRDLLVDVPAVIEARAGDAGREG